MSNRIDQLTDSVTALLDKKEARQRLRLLEEASAILIKLMFSVDLNGEGWCWLDRAVVRLEKQALRIGIDAGLL